MKRLIIALMYSVLATSCSVTQNWRGTSLNTSDIIEDSFEIKNLAGSGIDIFLIGKKASGSYRVEVE